MVAEIRSESDNFEWENQIKWGNLSSIQLISI